MVGRQPHTGALLDVAARLGHPEAVEQALARPQIGAAPEPAETSSRHVAERGREAFVTHCAPCHQTDGSGMERLATPLRNSTWVLGQKTC